jgi:hypothetical protein
MHLPLTTHQRSAEQRITQLSDDMIDEQYDSLFGGEKLPSLFDKTHDVGTTRTGIILKAPEDRQSRFYKAQGMGDLKFWGADGKPTKEATGPTGPNRPCMDTVFVLKTEYRLTEAQLASKEMDDDNGNRGVFASGNLKRAIKEAIKKSGAKKRTDLVGARLTLTRTDKKVKGEYEVWEWSAKIELGVGAAYEPPATAGDEFDD